MTTKDTNRLAMFTSVTLTVESNSSAWENLKAFADAFTTFKEHVENIGELSPAQGVTAAGAALVKRRLRKEMADLAFELGSATRSYAILNENEPLLKKVDFSLTDLSSGKGSESADRCQSVCDATKSVVAKLGDYDITAADVKELSDAITAYRGALPQPRQAQIVRKAVTAQLASEFDDADAALKDHMDGLLPRLRKSAPEFAAQYENARIIVDTAATRPAKPAPQPAPAPVK